MHLFKLCEQYFLFTLFLGSCLVVTKVNMPFTKLKRKTNPPTQLQSCNCGKAGTLDYLNGLELVFWFFSIETVYS